MIISISGMPGAGKSTVAKIISKKLGFKRFYMGGIIRKMAKEKGLTLEEFYIQNKDVDKLIDDYLVKLGQEEDNFIAEGRTAFYFIPHSIKLYLDINPKKGAARIFEELKNKNERNEKNYKNVNEVLEGINKRVAAEVGHYVNVHDKSNYDFVLDTTNLTIDEVLEKLLNFISKYNN